MITKWLNETNFDEVELVGGKNASLGEMIQNLSSLGIRIPNGFLITSVFMGFILFHSSMGMEVIIEDYIHTENLQKNIVSLSKLFHIVSFFFTIIILASI